MMAADTVENTGVLKMPLPVEVALERINNRITIMASRVDKIVERVTRLEEFNKNLPPVNVMRPPMELAGVSLTDLPLSINDVLSLPKHMQTTLVALHKLKGEADAEEIAEVTRRARAVESMYLNNLRVMGFLKKERRGRKVFFSFL